MLKGIDVDEPLDYATVKVFPEGNRYEVFACGNGEVEKLAAGQLELLLHYLPNLLKLPTKGADNDIKLQVVGDTTAAWFTKSTLSSFLNIVGSLDFMNATKILQNEISQLEEARNFHVSLYAQGQNDHFEGGRTDGNNSIVTTQTVKVNSSSSDTSKNELVRAMNLRLKELRKKLAAEVQCFVGVSYSSSKITALVEFCESFGATALKNCLCAFIERSQNIEMAVSISGDRCSSQSISGTSSINMINGNVNCKIPRPVQSSTPVKYGVSPAMVAQVEKRSSTESEESCDSSDDIQRSAERSRATSRSVQIRRSVSPMRRIQVGRSGSHRTTAVRIKSLGYYPARERTNSHGDDVETSEEEGPKQRSREDDMQRMSVQDAINLFERKQKIQTSDNQNSILASKTSLSATKSVLRRWSSGIAESIPSEAAFVVKDFDSSPSNELLSTEISDCSKEALESGFATGPQNIVETTNEAVESEGKENKNDPVHMETDANTIEHGKRNEKSVASAEWSQQKEEEVSQTLVKMMESHAVKAKKPQSMGSQSRLLEQKGGYKEKRDEKLRGENAGKRADNEAQFKAKQQTFDKRKSEMASRKVKDVDQKQASIKPTKANKSPSLSTNFRKDIPKTPVSRTVSTLPSTRKSWPSTPSTREVDLSGTKTLACTTPSLRKAQFKSSLPQSSAKVEIKLTQIQNAKDAKNLGRSLKGMQKKVQKMGTEAGKALKKKVSADHLGLPLMSPSEPRLKGMQEKVQQMKTACGKVTQKKIASVHVDLPQGRAPPRPNFYGTQTKKSSIVPVESRPLLHKKSGVGLVVGPTLNETKHSSQLEDFSNICGTVSGSQGNNLLNNASDFVTDYQDGNSMSLTQVDLCTEPEKLLVGHQNCGAMETFDERPVDGNYGSNQIVESSHEIVAEESTISPTAWMETEEKMNLPNSNTVETFQLATPVDGRSIGQPCTRHSLFQMLQQDNSLPATTDWGNAENPPAMVYQKDAPKGLKRLLKFARKSKVDAGRN